MYTGYMHIHKHKIIYTQKHKTNLNAHPHLKKVCSVRKKLIHFQIQAV